MQCIRLTETPILLASAKNSYINQNSHCKNDNLCEWKQQYINTFIEYTRRQQYTQ